MIDEAGASAGRTGADIDRKVRINWEVVAWLAVVALAVLTRLWGLGDRAMSHDESLHTYYSWKLFMGEGYAHDPMMHGPLLYHATALAYFLFGASDLTARLLAVFTGIGLVMSPLLLRKWLGRAGALAAGLMLLASPTVTYYSRYIRHDIPVELFTVLVFAAFIRFADDRRSRWVLLAAAAVAAGVTSAEMFYINLFVLGSFVAMALFVERLSPRAAGVVEIVMVALGVGLLVYASLASIGRLPSLDVTTEGSPARISMQISFLVSGLLLIYGLAAPLLNRPRAGTATASSATGPHLGDVLPYALARAVRPTPVALRAVIAGAVLMVVGLLLARGTSLAPSVAGLARLASLGGLLVGVGWFTALVGVIALLASRVGRHADAVAAVIGLVAVAVSAYLWLWLGGPQGLKAGPGLGSVTQATLAFVLVASLLVLLYAVLGLLLRGHAHGSLGAAVASAPLEAIGVGVAIFVVVYALLFTTFFTNSQGIWGFVNSIRYWLKQHEVVRGGQPWYYYGLFTPMYEFLPFALSVAAVVVYALRRRLRVGMGNDGNDADVPTAAAWAFVPGLIVWATGVFWIYSWAGEKMPWLIVHLTVPLALLGGRLIGDMARQVDWAEMRRYGWMVCGLVLLLGLALVGWFRASPFGGQTQEALARTSGFLIGIPIVLLLVWALWTVASRMSRRQAWLAVSMTVVAVLAAVTVRTALAANFQNDELATEYIVYAHGTPDDKEVYRMLQEMQLRAGVDKTLTVGYDNEVSWPWTWYFRPTEFPGAVYLGEKPTSALSQDVVLVGSPNYGNFEPYLRDRYVDVEYRRMWWPNEGYKNLTPNLVLQSLRDPKAWRNLLNILMYRKYTTDPTSDAPENKSLADWYHHANMKLYIKRSLLETIWPLVQARPDWRPEAPVEVESPSHAVESLTIEQTYEQGADGKPIQMPKGIALGEDGRVYVVDFGQDRIVVFGEDGKAVEQVAAGDLTYTTQDGQTDHSAWGVGVGPQGEVYVADTWNHRVLKYVGGTRVKTFGQFGNPASASEDLTMLFGPRDIAVGLEGNVFVTDTGNDRIIVLTPDLEPVRAVGGSGIEAGKFDEPTSVAFDPTSGDLYVADQWNYRIQRFDKDLDPVSQWVVEGWESQEAAHKAYIAVGGGLVVASDPAGQRVWVFDPQGKTLATLDLPADPRGLDQPIGVEVDAQGRIYVASSNSSLVTRYAPLPGLGAAEPATGADAAAGEEGEAQEGQGQDGELEPTGGATGAPTPTVTGEGADAARPTATKPSADQGGEAGAAASPSPTP